MKSSLLICLLMLLSLQVLGQVETVNSYDELQNYAGSADSLYIDHPDYYGLFYKDISGCEASDFGTKFNARSGCWRRVESNFSPRFWPLGGFSAFEGLIESNVDAINSAAYAAWKAGGDTVEIDKIYEIDEAVWLLENNTYLGVTDSAGFVRINPPKTILIEPAKVGDKQIIVQSNTGFRTGHKINIANGQEYDSIADFVSYTAGVSQELGGENTIFLSGRSIREDMEPGDSVSLFFPMMQEMSWSDARNSKLFNLVFDGNRKHYTLNYDWRVNTTILMSGPNEGAHIDNCRFYNIPSENIFLCRVKATHNSGNFFNGSAFHFSCPATDGETEILYNKFNNLNEIGNDVMKHSEGAFTFSSKVKDFRIAYNELSGLGEAGIAPISNDDLKLTITDNLINSDTPIEYRFAYSQAETNTVYNNKQLNIEDTFTGACFATEPKPVGNSPCNVGSTLENPLKFGDLIHITLDSLYLVNSNFNFAKGIFPQYDSEYFEYAGASLVTFDIDTNHGWQNTEYEDQEGLIFDNGHENGLFGSGNWGYEPCGIKGGCNALKLFFRVKKLPPTTSEVPCPLQGIKLEYDGDFGTWAQPVLCENSVKSFDQQHLGLPVLKGKNVCPPLTNLSSTWLSRTNVELEWSETNSSEISMVFFKTVQESKWRKKVVWSGNKTTLYNLPVGIEFYWMVKTKCDNEWSRPSEIASFISVEPDCGTATFERLHTGPRYPTQVRLNWDEMEGFKFNVRWKKAGASNTIWNSTTLPGFRYWINNLEPDTRYVWQVRTVCVESGNLVNSEWSDLQLFETASTEGSSRALETLLLDEETEEYTENKAMIFPNPAKEEVNLFVDEGTIGSIRISDSQGKVVVEQNQILKESNGLVVLSVAHLPAGVYLMAIELETEIQYRKLIIE